MFVTFLPQFTVVFRFFPTATFGPVTTLREEDSLRDGLCACAASDLPSFSSLEELLNRSLKQVSERGHEAAQTEGRNKLARVRQKADRTRTGGYRRELLLYTQRSAGLKPVCQILMFCQSSYLQHHRVTTFPDE